MLIILVYAIWCRSLGGMTLVHTAVRLNDVKTLRALLDADPRLLEAEEAISRIRPLRLACLRGSVEAVQLLLDRGADCSAHGPFDESPFLVACRYGHVAVVSLLLARGVDPSERGPTGSTAMVPAGGYCPKRHLGVLRLLIRDGRVPVDARDRDGRTALWRACQYGKDEMARVLLLEGGADRTIANRQGVTPMQLTAERCHNDPCHAVLKVRRANDPILVTWLLERVS